MPLVYDELHRLAQRYLRRERSDHTLQSTALVHEAYLRMVDQKNVRWQNRAHFFGVRRSRSGISWWTMPGGTRPPSAAVGPPSCRSTRRSVFIILLGPYRGARKVFQNLAPARIL